MNSSQNHDRLQFVLEQRRKFLKEMTALTGFAMITNAELCRAAPLPPTGDPENNDPSWGAIKGQLVLDGDIPERTEVDLEAQKIAGKDLEWFKSMGPILNEDWVVNKENKGVRWVIVWLLPEKAIDRKLKPAPKLAVHPKLKVIPADKKFVTIDQLPEGYSKHAVAIREGMGLKMVNSGPVQHAFHLIGFKNEERNIAMPPKTEIEVKDLKAERNSLTNTVNCPPHPWERMWLKIFNHPYYAVTDKDGKFEIKNAPAGKCRLVVWQESIGFKGGRKGRYGEVIDIKGAAQVDLGKIKLKVKTSKG
jgi:hypothetical protein